MIYINIYLKTKNTNLGLSTIHLVGVDMIEIAVSILNRIVFLWYKNA